MQATAHPAPFLETFVSDSRREHERAQLEVLVEYVLADVAFVGFSENISAGGLFLATFDVFPVGSHLKMNVELPQEPVMSLTGTVRWVREANGMDGGAHPGMGIQFDKLDRLHRQRIDNYVRLLATQLYAE